MLTADGFALGAAVATTKTTVQIVVFFAVILHKVRVLQIIYTVYITVKVFINFIPLGSVDFDP